MSNLIDPTRLLTARQISERIGASRAAVYRAIRSIPIRPAVAVPRGNLYDRDALEAIRDRIDANKRLLAIR